MAARLRNVIGGALEHVAPSCDNNEFDAFTRQRHCGSLAQTLTGCAHDGPAAS
jgi:hypothetical protein